MDRRVTFKRKFSIVCGFSPISLYVEDENGSEQIDGVNCRRLCRLQNGKERTVDICCSEVRLFVMVTRKNQTVCIGQTTIPSGSDNLKITGICQQLLSKEPAFAFFAKENEGVKYSKVSGPVKLLIVGVVMVLCLIAIHLYYPIMYHIYSISKVPAVFETEDMSITLTKAFVKVDDENFYDRYASGSGCLVRVIREEFEKYPQLSGIDADEYCNLAQKANGDSGIPISHTDGLTYFVVKDIVNERETIFYMFAYKTDDAFWLIQFGGYADEADYWIDSFVDFAKSVEFK